MTAVGSGVVEIRVHGQREYRTLYISRFEEAIYVLHVFEKRTQRTRKADIELARRDLSEV
jgi:phage-related protein